MTQEDKVKRLKEIKSELHDLANSFAGDETGTTAVYLHESANIIRTALKVLDGTEEDTIPTKFYLRSMGLG
jgi:hypothetical protein